MAYGACLESMFTARYRGFDSLPLRQYVFSSMPLEATHIKFALDKNGLKNLLSDLSKLKNPEKAKNYAKFFKTGKGEYGEGDKFLGITVPQQRKIAKKYQNLDLAEIEKLLNFKFHEHRLTALFILRHKYQNERGAARKKVVDFYLKHKYNINSWDLVDSSAPYILGDYLLDKNRSILYKLAKSKNLWDKRIAILATFIFIREKEFVDVIKIAEILLSDKHDLINKAIGWMLREIGKRDVATEEKFLEKYHKTMPRTMLRYAIEKFGEKKRRHYLYGAC